VGRFDGHADAPVRYGVHRPMEHVQGFMRSHWTPPSGENSPCIAPADAMVIDFWRKKSSCGVVKSLSKASVQKAQNYLELLTAVVPVIFSVSVFCGIRYARYRYFSVSILGV
jgi:hypothetical protein